MDEAQARAWVEREFDVPRETMARLDAFAGLLRSENERQNLVSRASLGNLWLRHIADSAQLLPMAPSPRASWVDLGTGAGFPGLIVALLHQGPVTLVEERRLRVEFLHRAAETLGVAVARLIAVVVLPTPPFWLATAMRIILNLPMDAAGDDDLGLAVGQARLQLEHTLP